LDKPPWTHLQAGAVNLWLVRHGRTAHNAERRFLGRTDPPLDDVGHRQARALAALMPTPTALWSSPLARARQTAAYLGEPTVHPDLAELDQGELEGLTGPEALARFPEFFAQWAADPAHAPVPGGETLASCQARALAALGAIARRHQPGDVVAIVAHQMVIASATAALAGAPLSRWRSFTVDHVSVTALAHHGGRLRSIAPAWVPPALPVR
jgi:broad specificity phosphatase PhoE